MMHQVDLTNCDQEAIHIPGAILPHGAMLVCDPDTLAVLQAAGDTETLVGASTQALPGTSLRDRISAAQADTLHALRRESDMLRPRHFLDPALRTACGVAADASVHFSDGFLVIEWEPSDGLAVNAADPLMVVQRMLEGIEATYSIQDFCDTAAQAVRTLTGYDRVMVYRFLEDDSGWVIAESREQRLAPFLDLHYPASDIPAQARALYAKTWLRLITQVEYTPAPLLPSLNPRTGRPLDMSFATLRNVSPMHRAYLRNMGVDASMSISIVCNDRLWGLFACHHYTPRHLPRRLRTICELFGSVFSLQLNARERAEQLNGRLASQAALQTMIRALTTEDDYVGALAKQSGPLLAYIGATGLSIRAPDGGGQTGMVVHSAGRTPPEPVIAALTHWLAPRMETEDIFSTDHLSEAWPPAREHLDTAAGLLAISISREPRDFIMWFRPEVVETVSWGGDPNYKDALGRDGEPLPPRKSFEIWKQIVYGRSAPWSERDAEAAYDLRVALLDVVLRRIHASAREQALAQEHQQRLIVELDHWMSNTLGVIQALVGHASNDAPSVNGYLMGLERRFHAMTRSHGLLTRGRGEGISLRALLREELAPHERGGNGAGSIRVEGADLILEPKVALSLSLALHELATNAERHGALSSSSGHVGVSWSTGRDGDVKLRWMERGGPDVRTPARRGVGFTLIEATLASQPGCKARLRFRQDGLHCDISLPASAIVCSAADTNAKPDALGAIRSCEPADGEFAIPGGGNRPIVRPLRRHPR